MNLIESHPAKFKDRVFEVRVYDRGSDYFVSGYEGGEIKTWSYTVGRNDTMAQSMIGRKKPYVALVDVVKANIKAGIVLA